MAFKKTFHRLIFWAHLVLGIAAGIVVLSMATTGIIISYEKQIANYVDRHYQVTPPAQAKPLPFDELVRKFQAERPDLNLSGVTLSNEAAKPAVVTIGRETRFYMDPYTGKVLGEGDTKVRGFFKAVTAWHRWLAGTGLPREVGKTITNVSNFVFLFLVISGIYLWWPKHWRWNNLKAVTVLNPKLKGRAREWNWHNAFGFWASFPLVIIICTGSVFAYPWASNLLFTLTGNEAPPPRQRSGPGGPGGQRGEAPPPKLYDLSGVSELIAKVEGDNSGWNKLTVRMPHGPDNHMDVLFDRGNGFQPHKIRTYEGSLEEKAIHVADSSFENGNMGRKLRALVRYTHTGEIGGWFGQLLAALTALSAALLVYTGFALSIRRFLQSRKKKKLQQAKAEKNS